MIKMIDPAKVLIYLVNKWALGKRILEEHVAECNPDGEPELRQGGMLTTLDMVLEDVKELIGIVPTKAEVQRLYDVEEERCRYWGES